MESLLLTQKVRSQASRELVKSADRQRAREIEA